MSKLCFPLEQREGLLISQHWSLLSPSHNEFTVSTSSIVRARIVNVACLFQCRVGQWENTEVSFVGLCKSLSFCEFPWEKWFWKKILGVCEQPTSYKQSRVNTQNIFHPSTKLWKSEFYDVWVLVFSGHPNTDLETSERKELGSLWDYLLCAFDWPIRKAIKINSRKSRECFNPNLNREVWGNLSRSGSFINRFDWLIQ